MQTNNRQSEPSLARNSKRSDKSCGASIKRAETRSFSRNSTAFGLKMPPPWSKSQEISRFLSCFLRRFFFFSVFVASLFFLFSMVASPTPPLERVVQETKDRITREAKQMCVHCSMGCLTRTHVNPQVWSSGDTPQV